MLRLSIRNCFIGLGLLATAAPWLPATSAAKEVQKKALLTRTEAQKDLRHLVRLLRKIHPNLYTHRSPKELKRRFEAIIGEVGQGEDRWGMLTKAQKILASVCDEHTGVDLNGERRSLGKRTRYWFAEPLIITNDGLLLEDLNSKTKPVAVKRINRRDAIRLRALLLDLVQADGCVQSDVLLVRHHPGLLLYLSQGLGKLGDGYSIDLEVPKKASPKHVVAIARGFDWASGLSRSHTRYSRQIPLSKLDIEVKNTAFSHERRRVGVWEKTSTDGRFSFVRVKDFTGGKEQEKEIDTIMRRIIEDKPEHVILDLTENPGGQIRRASQLLSYFLPRSHLIARRIYRRARGSFADKTFAYISAERKKFHRRNVRQFRKVRKRRGRYTLRVRRTSFGNPHYRGKLTVLVSPRTRSAAIIAALILKKERKATIIGFQDAGSIRTSCFAPYGHFTLPVSGIKVAIADTCYERERSKGARHGKLVPDIKVDPLAQPSDRLLIAIMEKAVAHVLEESGTISSVKD